MTGITRPYCDPAGGRAARVSAREDLWKGTRAARAAGRRRRGRPEEKKDVWVHFLGGVGFLLVVTACRHALTYAHACNMQERGKST
jgi:hypothetical protein